MRRNMRFALTLLLIVALGAVTRFWQLDLCMWGLDHAEALSRAVDFTANGRFPLRGLDASVGRPNPPGFIWLVAIAAAIRPDPVFTTGFIALLGTIAIVFTGLAGRILAGERAGILAAALLALSPYANVHCRGLWAQNVLPFFSSLVMWLMAGYLRRPSARWLIPAGVIALFMPQIHYSAVAIVPAVALGALYGLGRWRAPAWRKCLAIGSVAAISAVLWSPFWIDSQLRKDDPGRAERFGRSWWRLHGPAVPEPAAVGPDNPGLLFPSTIASTLNIHSADFMEYWVGLWNPTMHTRRHLWKTYGTIAGFALLISAGAAAGFWRRRRGRLSPRQAMARFLLLWMILPGAMLCGIIQLNYPHYFVICLPAGFLLMARHAEILRRCRAARPIERRFSILLLFCLAFSAVYLFCMALDIQISEGFPEGNYGTAYRFIVQENSAAPPAP